MNEPNHNDIPLLHSPQINRDPEINSSSTTSQQNSIPNKLLEVPYELPIGHPLPNHSQSMGNVFRESTDLKYNPFQVPPDIKLAKNHGLARRVCLPEDPAKINLMTELCPCCGLSIKNEQFPICVDTNDLVNMGSCFPAYFDCIKFCTVLMMILFLTSGIFLLLSRDVFGGVCDDFLNNNSLVCALSFIDLLKRNPTNQKIIRMLCALLLINVFVVIIAIEFFAILNHRKGKKLDNKVIAVNDFTVSISNLPLDTEPNHLRDFVLSKFDYNVNIENIYYIFDFSEYERLYQEKKKKIKEREKRKNIKVQTEKMDESLTEEDVDKDLNDFEMALQNKDHSKMKFTGTALITFTKVKDVKFLRNKWKFTLWQKFQAYVTAYMTNKPSNLSKFLYRGKLIKIRKAPLPSDLVWTHHLPADQKWKPRLVTTIVTVIILLIGMGIVVALKRVLKNEQENGDLIPVFSLGLSFAGSTVVALINTTLGIFIRRFGELESHSTKTGFFISVTYKLTRAFFLNMVVATFLSNFFTVTIREFYRPYEVNVDGLVSDIFFLFITNSYMSSIFNYFDIVWGYRLWRRHQIEKQGDQCTIPQCEANYIFEGHPVDMALRYANILKTVFFTAFYGPVVPLGYIFSFVGLIINYWVDKYLLIRRYVCENKISYQLPSFVMRFMKVSVILIGVINIIIALLPLYYQDKEGNIQKHFEMTGSFGIAMASFWVALVYYNLPRWVFFKAFAFFMKMKKKKKLNKEKDFCDVKKMFTEDYSSVHPILKVGEIDKKIKKNKTEQKKNQSLLGRTNSVSERRRMTIFDTIRKDNDKKSQINLQS